MVNVIPTDESGSFQRKASQFRNTISPDPSAEFPAEPGRYVLYLNLGCPWAHRANIVHKLKDLQDIIQTVVMGYVLTPEGWVYDGSEGSEPCDPLYGFTKYKQLYEKADPDYTGRYTVPALWDRKTETIVCNESSEIIRMLYTAFDAFIDPSLREDAKPLFPKDKQQEIEEMNEWVYNTVNNGVYKCGFASTQEAYNVSVYQLFESLDRLEAHLEARKTKFLFGDHITDADIRLYPTIARLDVAYFTIFKCNLKMIRYDYPRLHTWLKTLYWDTSKETNGGVFGNTTHFTPIKEGYTYTLSLKVVPAGPIHNILPFE